MEEYNLLMICFSALIAVFALLGTLAIVMKILTGLFPEKVDGIDSAVLAAIHSAYAVVAPGARITSIEEKKGRR